MRSQEKHGLNDTEAVRYFKMILIPKHKDKIFF